MISAKAQSFLRHSSTLDHDLLNRLNDVVHSDVVSSIISLLMGGVSFSEITVRKRGFEIKETIQQFVRHYWPSFTREMIVSLYTYGFVVVKRRWVELEIGSDMATAYPSSRSSKTGAWIPFIPEMSELTIYYEMKDGRAILKPQFRNQKSGNNDLKIWYGTRSYSFSTTKRCYQTQMYDIMGAWQQSMHAEQHIMTVLAMNANPPLFMEQAFMSKDARAAQAEEQLNEPSQYALRESFGTNYDNRPQEIFSRQSTVDDVYTRTVNGGLVDPADNTRVVRPDLRISSEQPTSRYVFNDVNLYRNRLLLSAANIMGVPSGFLLGNSTKISTVARNDSTRLLETRITMIREAEQILALIWNDIYEDSGTQFYIPFSPVIDLKEIMEMISMGILKDATMINELLFHVTGVEFDIKPEDIHKLNVDIETTQAAKRSRLGSSGKSSSRSDSGSGE